MADEIKNEGGGEQSVFVDHAVKAVKEHISFEKQSIVPDYRTFISDTDVYVGLYGITVHAGMYLLKAEVEDINEALVYTLNFDLEGIAQAHEGLPYEETTDEKTGITTRTYGGGKDGEGIPISFSATVEPIPTKEGKHLTYLEYLAWLSMTVAESDDTRDDIFKSAYGIDVNSLNVKARQSEELPQQDTARPRKRQDPKTKISRIIGIPEKNEKLYQAMGVPLTVASESEKRRGIGVEQIVAIEYKGADGIIPEGREQLTLLDRQVHNAIISHFVAGNRNISLIQICELVYGHNKPTDEQRREVEECIERQMWTRISIDMSDEAREHTLKHPELLSANFTLEGQMLAVQKITVRAANGKKIVAYRLMGEPILYTHAQVTGQILTYSAKLLQAPKGINNTEKNMAIRQTLLEEIRRAKDGKRSKFMKYDTIYKDSGQIPNGRTERSRQNKVVRGYLDVFKKEGEISAWEERREGRKITGFEVFFPVKQKANSKRKTRRS